MPVEGQTAARPADEGSGTGGGPGPTAPRRTPRDGGGGAVPPARSPHRPTAEVGRESNSEHADVGPFVLPMAPDRLTKDNVSGGPPAGIVLPDGCVDGLFVGETPMPFVSYLNWVFRHGGFPWPTGSEREWRVKASLAKDLLPL